MIYLTYKTRYLNEEVSRTEPSPSASVPWLLLCFVVWSQPPTKQEIIWPGIRCLPTTNATTYRQNTPAYFALKIEHPLIFLNYFLLFFSAQPVPLLFKTFIFVTTKK
jgi:hypothetical protein